MRTVFAASTAVALVLAAPLSAEMTQSEGFTYESTGEEIQASGFIGARVYAADKDVNEEATWLDWDGTATNWDDIGEIHDVLMTRDGDIAAILVDVGGFLGMGEKQVSVSMDKLKLVSDGDDAEDYFVVFQASPEMIENAPLYETGIEEKADAGMHDLKKETDAALNKAGETMDDVATSVSEAAESAQVAVAETFSDPDIPREGYSVTNPDELTAEELTGARVYDAKDEWIGEVSELMIDDNGHMTGAVIDVGGFLGLGEKPVKMGIEDLSVQTTDNGEDVRVFVDVTKDLLLEAPEYKG